ncbi:MAG: hypothetical protein JXM71_11045 [Spirochaetales bacterium]|nr:hypothetical protein [Spirochaetales bacterium]
MPAYAQEDFATADWYHGALDRGESLRENASAIAAASGGVARAVSLPGAADMAFGYATGDEPVVAFLVRAIEVEGSYWSQAVWLAMMHALAGAKDTPAGGGTLFIAYDDAMPAWAVVPEPGDPVARQASLSAALLDMGVRAVVVIDCMERPSRLTLVAAAASRQTPLRVVKALRAAVREAGVSYSEQPIVDFYAAAGIHAGSVALEPWLMAGVPAIALESTRGDDGATIDVGVLALAIPARVVAAGSDDDVHYFRYPLPKGVVTIGDDGIVALLIGVVASLGVLLALGYPPGGRRIEREAPLLTLPVLRETLAALAQSLAAFAGAAALAGAAISALGYFGGFDSTLELLPGDWFVVLAISLRLAATLALYYTVSGLGSRLGIHGNHGRVDAAKAAMWALAINVGLAVVYLPTAVPYLVVVLALVTCTAAVSAASGPSLLFASALALPLADPRALAAVSMLPNGYTSVGESILNAGFPGIIAMAAFAAPFGLWLVAASSPIAYLRRGRKTFGFWLAGALIFALAEAVIRSWAGLA